MGCSGTPKGHTAKTQTPVHSNQRRPGPTKSWVGGATGGTNGGSALEKPSDTPPQPRARRRNPTSLNKTGSTKARSGGCADITGKALRRPGSSWYCLVLLALLTFIAAVWAVATSGRAATSDTQLAAFEPYRIADRACKPRFGMAQGNLESDEEST